MAFYAKHSATRPEQEEFVPLKDIADKVGLERRTVLEWLARAGKEGEKYEIYKPLKDVLYGKDYRGRWCIHKEAVEKFKEVKGCLRLVR